MYYCYFDTPIGELLLAGEDNALSMIGFPKELARRLPGCKTAPRPVLYTGRTRECHA